MSQSGVCDRFDFSHFNRIWGWATWRESWYHFDLNMSAWPKVKTTKFMQDKFTSEVVRHYTQIFDRCYRGEIDTWDYQWLFARLQHGVAIFPMVNLVCNIGFKSDGTHTTNPDSPLSSLKVGKMEFPLIAPSRIVVNRSLDIKWARECVCPTLSRRIFRRIKSCANRFQRL